MKTWFITGERSKNMYSPNRLSCRVSNNQAVGSLPTAMETDFLNFHDEEHFGTALYQNELLDDSQSSILDIVGDGYHRDNYEDHHHIWEQDVERELNGDLAVIPMSGQINSFPKLSNSPPTKDFQKIFSDWQHLTSIESAPSDDLAVDLQLSNQGLVVDMLDCLTPSTVSPSKIPPIVSSFDFSNTEIPQTQTKFKPKEIKIEKKSIRKTGGKNLELLKKVIKVENDIHTTFKTEIPDELDVINDNFDITSYVNGFDDVIIKHENKLEPIKLERKKPRRFGGCYEKIMPEDEPKIVKPAETKLEILQELKKDIKVEIKKEEDELIDVETVSEQIPVLEARDLNSLLEQFEATEAVNPTLPTNVFEDKPPSCQYTEPKTSTTTSIKTNEIKKVKQLNSELKQPNKNVSIDIINKIKANTTKKPISLIPARPTKKIRTKKIIKPPSPVFENNSVQFDHDYCSISPTKNDINLKKVKSPEVKKCDTSCDNDEINRCKKNIANIIDDTAIRIGKQIKNAINNENALKQKQIIKTNDSKVMISLLKSNRNINLTKQTIINTINTNSEQIQNIIVRETIENNSKKRKLNLEEYKKLRGEIIKTSTDNSCQNSPGNSGSNSPLPASTNKIEYQERIMKMASEILKTNAKQKTTICETKLDEFVPPEIKKKTKTEIKEENLTPTKKTKPEIKSENPVPKPKKNYQIKTIVSVGVNTDESYIKNKNELKNITNKKKEEISSPKANKNEIKSKLNEIITPILQNASNKINSNSLITNITETLLQKSPKISPKNSPNSQNKSEGPKVIQPPEHGEDKTVIILNKNDHKPEMKTIAIQTEVIEEKKEEKKRNYRTRRDSSASSVASGCSGQNNLGNKKDCGTSLLNSSSISISSSLGSRWSRSKSRSRSRSRSSSHSEYSSYSSDSSRSVSPRRWHTDRNSRSRDRYNRSRRQSRSRSSSYRGNYRQSRSPYSRSRSKRRERESAERERMKEVEERRVVYVGKISDETTRTDLRRRFQSFGPITNVSVHFRDHGDNYGFVTFAYKMDAYEAVERGNDDPNLPKYDISFGGRRAFCKTRYSDLDNIRDDSLNPAVPVFRQDADDSFDMLLREVQAKLRKRKV